MSRRERQGAILQLVRSRSIATQTELAEALRDQGFEVVQTTVSRDIAELGLLKVRDASGRLVYAPPGAGNGDRFRELALAIRRWALTFQASGQVLAGLQESTYVQLWLDTAYGPTVGGAMNEGIVNLFGGQGSPSAIIENMTNAAATL